MTGNQIKKDQLSRLLSETLWLLKALVRPGPELAQRCERTEIVARRLAITTKLPELEQQQVITGSVIAALIESQSLYKLSGEHPKAAEGEPYLESLFTVLNHYNDYLATAPSMAAQIVGLAVAVGSLAYWPSAQELDSSLPGRFSGELLDYYETLGKLESDCVEASSEVNELQVQVRSLGQFQVSIGGRLLREKNWRTQKTKYLVAYLLQAGRKVRADNLLELFWPQSELRGHQNLWAATSAARRALGHRSFIVRQGDYLLWNPALPCSHDYDELHLLLHRVEALGTEFSDTQLSLNNQIAALYRSPYLKECQLEWASNVRQLLEDRIYKALIQGARACLDAEHHDQALGLAMEALRIDPFNSEAFLVKIEIHLKRKEPELAMKCYRRCKAMLAKEFDLGPTPAMLAVLNSLRAQIR